MQTRVFPWLLLLLGAMAGAWARGFWAPEPRWAERLAQRMEEQGAAIERQRLAFDALSGAMNELRATPPAANPSQGCLTPEQLRAELGGGRDRHADEALRKEETNASAQAVVAGEHAMVEASRLMDRASATGVWDEQHAAEFRSLALSMTPAQRDEAMSVLTTALNEHRLKLVAHAPF